MSVLLYLASLTALCGVSYSPSNQDFIATYQITLPSTFNSVHIDADGEDLKLGFNLSYTLYLDQSNNDNIIYSGGNSRNNVYTIPSTDLDTFLLTIKSISLSISNFDIYITGQSGLYFGYDLTLQYNNSDNPLEPNLTTIYSGYFSDYLRPVDGESNHTIIDTNSNNHLFNDVLLGTSYEITEDNLQSIFESGYALGYGAGYSDGERDGYTEGSSKLNGSWVDWIVSAVQGFFDTPLFGEFTLGGILTTVLGIYLMCYMLKIFAGG